jgi:hypothetical protein
LTINRSDEENDEIPKKDFKPIVKCKRPVPRDGHSTDLIADRFMLLFGGDRHHMPFNDLQILDLGKELEDHLYLFDE